MGLKCASLLFILVVVAFGSVDAVPEGYISLGNTNSYYKYHSMPVGWPEANASCRSEGGFLFYPETKHDLEEVLGAFDISSNYISIGISDLETKGVLKTVLGRPISQVTHYSKWKGGNLSQSQSGYVYLDISYRELSVYSEAYHQPFICKFQPQPTNNVVMTSAEEIKTAIANFSGRVVEAIQTQSDRLSNSIANQATATARRTETIPRQNQATYRQLDTLLKQSSNQTAILEKLAESVGLLVQATMNQTIVIERQTQALQILQKDDNNIDARSEQ